MRTIYFPREGYFIYNAALEHYALPTLAWVDLLMAITISYGMAFTCPGGIELCYPANIPLCPTLTSVYRPDKGKWKFTPIFQKVSSLIPYDMWQPLTVGYAVNIWLVWKIFWCYETHYGQNNRAFIAKGIDNNHNGTVYWSCKTLFSIWMRRWSQHNIMYLNSSYK